MLKISVEVIEKSGSRVSKCALSRIRLRVWNLKIKKAQALVRRPVEPTEDKKLNLRLSRSPSEELKIKLAIPFLSVPHPPPISNKRRSL